MKKKSLPIPPLKNDFCQPINLQPTQNLFLHLPLLLNSAPNGWRYPRVGGMKSRHFDGTNFKPRKLLENAPTPTRRVHAVLAAF